MVIYTKKGDKGVTSVCDAVSGKKKRVSKDSLKIEVLGLIDELNSFLGIVISFSNLTEVSSYLKDVQKNLMIIGSFFAGDKLKLSAFQIKKLENLIDKLEDKLPKLSNFILPGGTVLASHLQYARSLARRAERGIVSLSKTQKTDSQILAYMNRLSDFLFILARFVNFEARLKEEVWSGKISKNV